MKQVFYSEKLDKNYNTKKECEEAERIFDEKEAEKAKAKEARATEAKAVEDAYKNVIETRKKASETIKEANELIRKAEEEYYEKKREFIKKHGSFHMTYSNSDKGEEITVGDLFNAMTNIFRINL